MKKNNTKSKICEELILAFKKECCPICNLSYISINNYFSSIFYESANDPEIRRGLRNSLGYCKNHSVQLIKFIESSYNRLGASIVFEDIARESIKKLEGIFNSKFKKITSENKKKLCPACRYQERLEKIYLYEFANCLKDDYFYNNFIKNSTLCFQHLSELIKSSRNKYLSKKIFEEYKIKIGKDIKLINSFIKKNDYRNRDNTSPEEAGAWKEVIKKIKGLQKIS